MAKEPKEGLHRRLTELLRFMQVGDVVFIPIKYGLDRDIHSKARYIGITVSVSRWVAVLPKDEPSIKKILRIERTL